MITNLNEGPRIRGEIELPEKGPTNISHPCRRDATGKDIDWSTTTGIKASLKDQIFAIIKP